MGALSDIEQAIANAVERGGATVGIRSRHSAGTGVVVADGVVLTNAHNVPDGGVDVVFAGGTVHSSDDIAGDPDLDVAVVRVATGSAEPLTWRSADTDVRIGTSVVALSNPAGQGLRATFGTVSALDQTFRGPRGRRITGSIEHTAPLQRGSSGGPIVDADGAFCGLNTSRLGDGFYLAIPADANLRGMVDRLSAGEPVQRVRLGIAIAPAPVARRLRSAVGLPDRSGLLVHRVAEGTPAEAAGLTRGDLLVRAGDVPLERVDDLHAVLDRLAPGSQLALDIVRGVDEQQVTVTF